MLLAEVERAIDGAEYHEVQAFSLVMPNEKGEIPENRRLAIIFHLRAYYWELWSVWDYVLLNANSQTLSLKRVDTGLVEILKKKFPGYKYLNLLEQMLNDPLFQRIQRLRHYSHGWVLNPYLVEYTPGEGANVISLLMNDKSSPEQVNVDRNDLWFMKSHVQRLKNVGFFS